MEADVSCTWPSWACLPRTQLVPFPILDPCLYTSQTKGNEHLPTLTPLIHSLGNETQSSVALGLLIPSPHKVAGCIVEAGSLCPALAPTTFYLVKASPALKWTTGHLSLVLPAWPLRWISFYYSSNPTSILLSPRHAGSLYCSSLLRDWSLIFHWH